MKPLAMLLPGGKKNAADRLDRAALAADNAAHVVLSDAHLDTHRFAIRTRGYLDLIGLADQCFDDFFYSFFHLRSEKSPTFRLLLPAFLP